MSQTKAQLIDPVDGTIVNADINASAAIAGTKVSPDFGSQNIATTGIVKIADGSVSAPALAFTDDLDTGIFSVSQNTINFTTGGVERLEIGTSLTVFNEDGADVNFRIESDNNANMFFVDAGNDRVGIGTSSPSSIFHVRPLDETNFLVRNEGSTVVLASETNSGRDNNRGMALEATAFEFIESGSEKMRIDSSGRLLLGTSTARAVGGESNPRLHIEGSGNTSNSWMNLTRFADNNGSANIQFAKSRSNTSGTYTVVQNGDSLGQLSFLGADGTDMANYASIIKAQVDGTPGSNDMPGRLVFMTTADGGTFPTERLRIDSSGNTHFGSSGTLNGQNTVSIIPSDGRISFGMDGRTSFVTGESGSYIYSGEGASGTTLAGDLILQSRSNGDRTIRFITGSSPAQRLSITNNGLLFGTDTAAANALDDYEEGSWTPIFDTSISGGSITVNGYSIQSGFYRKIGSLVYVEGALRTSNPPTKNSNGTWDIGGLPFTSASGGTDQTSGQLHGGSQQSWSVAPDKFTVITSNTRARAREGLDDGASTYSNGNTTMFNTSGSNVNRVYFSGTYIAA